MKAVAVDVATLNDRQREILQAVVEDYIATAEPVGSRSLKKRRRIDVSAATIRNTMADLEEFGYLSATHASAGRIPTAQAFRVYVEHLASRGRISMRDREVIKAVAFPGAEKSGDIREVLREAGRALSTLAHHATIVMLPHLEEVIFADIEFVPVREDSVLAVFVAKSGLVQHRVVPVDVPMNRDELRRMSSYLKSLLDGKTLTDIRSVIIEAMRNEQAQADKMMRQALVLGERAIVAAPRADDLLVGGERTLLDQPEFADIERMRKLMRAFEEKTVLLRLIDAALLNPVDAQMAMRADTQVVFGAEASVRETKDLAVVVSKYAPEGGPSGQVAVVGPLRMNYSRVIPLVEYTAESLDGVLGSGGTGGGTSS